MDGHGTSDHSRRMVGCHAHELVGSAICNGSFGEVLQGVRENGRKFLVNMKIKNYSRATVYLSESTYRVLNERHYWKSYQLVRKLIKGLGYEYDCYIDLQSNVPIGKGLSSSTADMVASAKAVENALSITLDNDFLAKEISAIEPNDGLHYPGTSFYEHVTGNLIYNVQFIPKFKIVGVDFGGEVDTLAFNRSGKSYDAEDRVEFERLIEELKSSYQTQDAVRIARVATQSSLLSQKVLYKPYLDKFLDLSQSCSALGVANTHSGTYLGMIFDRELSDYSEIYRKINAEFKNVEIGLFETVTFWGGEGMPWPVII